MQRTFKVTVDGKEYIIEVEEIKDKSKPAHEVSQKQAITQQNVQKQKQKKETAEKPKKINDNRGKSTTEKKVEETESAEGTEITSPMTGVILDIYVSPGDKISRGDKVILMEAMKMENTVLSDYEGTVKTVKVNKGDNIDAGDVIVVLK